MIDRIFKLASWLKIGLVAVSLIMLARTLAGCSETATQVENEIPALSQVRNLYSGAAITTAVEEGLNFEFYRKPGLEETAICVYVRPDSCLVLTLTGDGDLIPPSGMKANVWKCIARNIQVCQQIYGEPQDPVNIEKKNRCLATGMASCMIAYGLFGWLCE